jgi:hypothetical protein
LGARSAVGTGITHVRLGGRSEFRHEREEDAMTLTAQLCPELADSPCSVADCLETAEIMGSTTVAIDPDVGAPPDFGSITFGLPLCVNHAYLLRLGCSLTCFTSGL